MDAISITAGGRDRRPAAAGRSRFWDLVSVSLPGCSRVSEGARARICVCNVTLRGSTPGRRGAISAGRLDDPIGLWPLLCLAPSDSLSE